MKQKKDIGYIVVHTHWDREWRYPIWENRMMLVEFMQELFGVLETQPDYKCFVTDGQCVLIEDYLEARPDDEEIIKQYVKEGRISIGPWYTLPDLYPVCGESLIRNLLSGIRYSTKFGGYLKVGYNSFGWGQTAQFPQIYRGFGIDTAIAAKHVSKVRAPDSEFLWEAPDGSMILTTRLGIHGRANFFKNSYITIVYGTDFNDSSYGFKWDGKGTMYHRTDENSLTQDHFRLEETGYIHDDKIKDAFNKAWKAVEDTTVKSHRLIMNGCDFTTPQPLLETIIEKANRLFEDKEFKLSTLEEYADVLKKNVDYKNLKVVRGELRDGPSPSCSGNALATRSYIKKENKIAQNMLFAEAEPLSVIGCMVGTEYQRTFLNRALKYMLLSQAHDSINGVTQDRTVEDVMYRLAQVKDISRVVWDKVCGEIIKKINTDVYESDDILLVIFNTLPFERNEIVRAYVDIPREKSIWEFEIEDSTGNRYPIQFVSRKEVTVPVHELYSRPWPFRADRYCFYMDTGAVPAGGYKVYKLIEKMKFQREIIYWPEVRKTFGENIASSPSVLENEYIRANVNKNGSITVYDKLTGLKTEEMNYFEDTGDCGDYWVYMPPYNNRTYTSKGLNSEIWLEDNGVLSATITSKIILQVPKRADIPENYVRGESRRTGEGGYIVITSSYTLRKGSRSLEVYVKINNQAEDHRLRAMFDTLINADYACSAGHFTVDKRPLTPVIINEKGEYYPEMGTLPMQDFVDLSDGTRGIAIINNCLCEYEAIDNNEATIAITLFRAVRNTICTEYRAASEYSLQKGGQCLGENTFSYSICPHEMNWEKGELYNKSQCFNVPLKLIQTGKHQKKGNLPLELSFYSIDSKNIVISSLKKAEDNEGFIIRVFNPAPKTENILIKTFLPIKEAWYTNLNEDKQKRANIRDKNTIELKADANKIITILFEF